MHRRDPVDCPDTLCTKCGETETNDHIWNCASNSVIELNAIKEARDKLLYRLTKRYKKHMAPEMETCIKKAICIIRIFNTENESSWSMRNAFSQLFESSKQGDILKVEHIQLEHQINNLYAQCNIIRFKHLCIGLVPSA